MKHWKLITQLLAIFVFLFISQVFARFLAVDPVRVVDQNGEIDQEILHNPQRLNLYTYGLNNPYRFVDPDGRSPEFALSPTEYFALRADGIGADPYTWEGTNRTARYLQNEALSQASAMLTLYGGARGVFARSPRLMNANKAIIDPRKLTEYALNPNHPIGGNKAKVFDSVLGFNKSNYKDLLNQLAKGVRKNTPTPGKVDKYGSRFTVDIPVTGPKGSGTVRTGWIYKSGSNKPELTTLFVK